MTVLAPMQKRSDQLCARKAAAIGRLRLFFLQELINETLKLDSATFVIAIIAVFSGGEVLD
jgi:hypothetical protein